MRILIPLLSLIIIGLMVFNATKLNFNALLQGESLSAIITILAGLCALVLLQILRISKKIEKLQKRKS